MEFPKTRFCHCYMVGLVMQYVAEKYYGYNDRAAAEMFVLGYLHDSMYDYETNETLHNEIIAGLLPDRYKLDVLHHSTYQTEYASDVLDMLYFADQIVDGSGKVCSFEERMADILNRHGIDDGVYKDTVDIVDHLRTNSLFVKIEADLCVNTKDKPAQIPVEEMNMIWVKAKAHNQKQRPADYLNALLSESDNIIFDNYATSFSKEIQTYLARKL